MIKSFEVFFRGGLKNFQGRSDKLKTIK